MTRSLSVALAVLGTISLLTACSGRVSTSGEGGSLPVPPPQAVASSVTSPPTTALRSTDRPIVTPSEPDEVPSSPAGGEEPASVQATGVVVAVDGDLSAIVSFSIITADGVEMELEPAPGLLFDGGPLSHLQDHLRSGGPIAVEFHREAGRSIATRVGDAE